MGLQFFIRVKKYIYTSMYRSVIICYIYNARNIYNIIYCNNNTYLLYYIILRGTQLVVDGHGVMVVAMCTIEHAIYRGVNSQRPHC